MWLSFPKPEEEHLQCLCVVFECFWEHNLKLKLSKCKFFCSEINYLAHHVSKEGIQPSKENLKAVAEFTLPQTYTEIWAFLGLVGHYQQFIKGFAHVAQPLHEHLSREGAGKKSEWVTLTSDAQVAFETLKKACLEAPVLAFADFDKPFLLETDASKLWLGQCYCRSSQMGDTTLLHMQADPWPSMSKIIILPSRSSWLWSGQLLSSSRNTYTGNCLLWKLTITHLPTFWLLPI